MFTADLHPRAPAGVPAGGQFTVGSSSPPAKTAPAKTPAARARPAARKTTSKNNAAAKAAQAKARSVPFAELKRLTTIANNGGKLTPAQQAIVNAGKTAHADHEQHLAVAAAKAKPKARATVKTAPKPKTAKKATAKAAPKPTTPAQAKANAAAFRL